MAIKINLIIKILRTSIFFSFLLIFSNVVLGEDYKDSIIAVVNDRVILKSEVQEAINNLTKEEITKDYSTLNQEAVIKKIIDKLISDSLLIQAADRFGIAISDIALEKRILELSKKQNLTMNDFRENIIKNGMRYEVFVKRMRDNMTIEALFVSQFYSRMNVTEEEVDNFIQRENIDEYGELEFDIIELVINDENKIINQESIQEIYEYSKTNTFLETKSFFQKFDLNVRNIGKVKRNELPDLFVKALLDKKDGEITSLIKSSKGYHVLRVVSVTNMASTLVDEYKVRHILIKPNPMKTDKDVKNQLYELRNNIKNIDDFADYAKRYSEDDASAIRGGDLNWQRERNLVAEFSSVMRNTPVDTISDPFISQFGWHILYLENKRTVDDARSVIRQNVAKAIRINKAKRERDDWMAKLKDQAYIDIKGY